MTTLSSAFAEDIEGALKYTLQSMEEADEGTPVEELLSLGDGVSRVETFAEAMLMTSDKGLSVKFNDGSEAFITIVATTP
jgi:hypothetical protein